MTYLTIDKYTDLDECLIIKISYAIMIIKNTKETTLYDLHQDMKSQFVYFEDSDLLEVLDLLYLFEIINYDVSNDLIRMNIK